MAGQGDHAYLVAGALVDTPCTFGPLRMDDQLKLPSAGAAPGLRKYIRPAFRHSSCHHVASAGR